MPYVQAGRMRPDGSGWYTTQGFAWLSRRAMATGAFGTARVTKRRDDGAGLLTERQPVRAVMMGIALDVQPAPPSRPLPPAARPVPAAPPGPPR